jgi:4-amino-4-deoxy-L-arabinose transferase-like glycosyltransferase
VPAAAPPRERSKPLAFLALGAVVAAAALLRFWTLGLQGLWYDEAMTGWLLRGTPGQLLGAIPHTESTPPLYYLIAWGWVRVFGDTEVGLRSLSALAGVATVVAVFAAGRLLASRRVGLVAAALVAVNPLLVWYSQEARAYALLVLAVAVSLWLFARARERPTPGRLVAWSLAGALALSTHYFAVFVLAPEALMLLADRRPRLRWRLLAMAIVAATGLGLVGLVRAQRHHAHWIETVPLRTRIDEIVQQFLVGFQPPAGRTAVLIAGAAVVVAVVLLAVRALGAERRGAAVAAVIGITGVGLPLLFTLGGVDYLDTRNVIGALAPLAIVVAAGLGSRRAGIAGLGATVVLLALSVFLVVRMADDPNAQRPAWNRVAAVLGPSSKPRAILLRGSATWARSLGFYIPNTWWMKRGGAKVTEIDVVRRIPNDHQCAGRSWWGAACDVAPKPGRAAPPARGFRLVSSRNVVGFAVTRYRSARPIHIYQFPPYRNPRQPVETTTQARKHKMLLTPTRAPVVP